MTTEHANKTKPVHTVKLGSIRAAVWRRVNTNGQTRHSVTFERIYKSADGFRSMHDFNAQELVAVIKACELALSWVMEAETPVATKPVSETL